MKTFPLLKQCKPSNKQGLIIYNAAMSEGAPIKRDNFEHNSIVEATFYLRGLIKNLQRKICDLPETLSADIPTKGQGKLSDFLIKFFCVLYTGSTGNFLIVTFLNSPVHVKKFDTLCTYCFLALELLIHGIYCNAPGEIYKSHTLSNVFYKSSEGFSTPVTSLMPPKPARTERKHYSWRKSNKREICMSIRILDPLELRNNGRKELMYENKRSMNYREAEYLFPDGKGMVTSLISDVTIREKDGELSLNKPIARQREKTRDRLRPYTEEGYRKVVKSYNKVITVITFYCLLITQILKGITSPRPLATRNVSRVAPVCETMEVMHFILFSSAWTIY